MNSTTIAVDVAKAEVAVSEHAGQVRERHRFSRERFRRYLGEQPPATLLMEACGSAHYYWDREAQTRGHRVVLLPPHAVRPYVVRNTTDRTDAKGLLEAARNDEVRPGPVKSETQQAPGGAAPPALYVAGHTHGAHQPVRGLLREFGVVIPIGARHVVQALGAVLEDADAGVPSLLRPAFAAAAREIREIEGRICTVEHQLDAVAEQTPVVSRLRSIPGIGLVTATALVAAAAMCNTFPRRGISPATAA